MITHGSMCTGYDGLGLALNTILGAVSTSWVADVDPDASTILTARRPGVPNLGDITGGAADHIAYERNLYTTHGVGRLAQLPDDGARLAWADALMRRTAHTMWDRVEPVDVLTAGWPCQENSTAGKRAGAAGARHLWPAVAAAIGALKPRLFIGENVPGILTIDSGERMREVLVDLNASGYAVRWTTVGACKIGACHHRHRMFFLAVRDGGLPAPEGAMFGAPLASVRRWPQTGHVQSGELWPMPAEVCGATGSTFPTPTARDADHGSGRGDQPGRPLSEVIVMLPTPTASDTTGAGHAGQGAANLRTVVAMEPDQWGRWAAAVIAHETTFGTRAPTPTRIGVRGGPRLGPAFVEWMMDVPTGWVTGVPIGPDAQIKALGNGVVPAQAAHALRAMGIGELTTASEGLPHQTSTTP
jgi:DNA (cytosine-5)-methyltransferase 1